MGNVSKNSKDETVYQWVNFFPKAGLQNFYFNIDTLEIIQTWFGPKTVYKYEKWLEHRRLEAMGHEYTIYNQDKRNQKHLDFLNGKIEVLDKLLYKKPAEKDIVYACEVLK